MRIAAAKKIDRRGGRFCSAKARCWRGRAAQFNEEASRPGGAGPVLIRCRRILRTTVGSVMTRCGSAMKVLTCQAASLLTGLLVVSPCVRCGHHCLFEKLPHARTEADILELAPFRITTV